MEITTIRVMKMNPAKELRRILFWKELGCPYKILENDDYMFIKAMQTRKLTGKTNFEQIAGMDEIQLAEYLNDVAEGKCGPLPFEGWDDYLERDTL